VLIRLLTPLALLIALVGATAPEASLFPQQQITVDEWETLRANAKAAPDSRDISRPEEPDLEAIEVHRAVYYFTRRGPAHPSVIFCGSRGRNASRCEAYSAGAPEEFEKWLAAFWRNPPPIAAMATLSDAITSQSKLFPQDQITAEEWEALHTRVKTAPGARDESRGQPDLEVIAVPDEPTVYYFTAGGAAHPAVIALRTLRQSGTVAAMHMETYYVGSKDNFQKWFASVVVATFGPQLPQKPRP